ncbi:GDP dissociation inhibitor [Corchorus olitorius]|uniref:GDP dissociation inhibitor n=1 Tax=Corchorus olitorius TaxID=93759 RepID=A0A1R3GXF2_9ROSI|nr:GDP dissociation inhibitor [Corchorus olitorius]
MADYDQDDVGDGGDLLKTEDGLDQLALYSASFGWFRNAAGAMKYPVYRQGELPQAFCRCAALKGCLYDSGSYKGVRLASAFRFKQWDETSVTRSKKKGPNYAPYARSCQCT